MKLFKKNKDGFGLWNCFIIQYTGVANWEQEGKRNLDLMRSIEWKGNNNITLIKHAQLHCSCYANIEEAAVHCDIQTPSKQQQIEYFTSSIKCNDPNLNACLANIDTDHRPDSYRNNFEEFALYAIEVDIVELSQGGKKAVQFDVIFQVSMLIYLVLLLVICSLLGFDYHWYKIEEYLALSET